MRRICQFEATHCQVRSHPQSVLRIRDSPKRETPRRRSVSIFCFHFKLLSLSLSAIPIPEQGVWVEFAGSEGSVSINQRTIEYVATRRQILRSRIASALPTQESVH